MAVSKPVFARRPAVAQTNAKPNGAPQAAVPPTAVVPDVKTAYDTLFSGIQARVFFNKLAALGRTPRSAEQAGQMLKLAGQLRFLEEQGALQAAQHANDPYKAAADALDQHFAPVFQQYGQPALEEMVAQKQAAVELADDPGLYHSVLVLKMHEAIQNQQLLAG